MAEIYDSPAEGNNKTVIIIVAVAAVVLLLCCCLIAVGAGGYYFYSGNGVDLPVIGPSLDETFTYNEDGYNVEFKYPGDWYADGEYGSFFVGSMEEFQDLDEPLPGEFYMSVFFH